MREQVWRAGGVSRQGTNEELEPGLLEHSDALEHLLERLSCPNDLKFRTAMLYRESQRKEISPADGPHGKALA
eukprot:SAG22_NODE_1136_length_5395_cov_2.101189_4_plen_73_part_00